MTEGSDMPAADAARSGSNGSPATDAPSSTSRAPSESTASPSVRAAATIGGTRTPASDTSWAGYPEAG